MVLWTKQSLFLLELGLSPQHLGFGYLTAAICAMFENPLSYYTKQFDYYAVIHKYFGVSKAQSSRCMRYAIEKAWTQNTSQQLRAIFPEYPSAFPPTVHEFICKSALEMLRIEFAETASISPQTRDYNSFVAAPNHNRS